MQKLYRERFLRQLGAMTESDLERIRATKIAIGGLGLGGAIFLNLVRLGFENFHVSDPDVYERTNIARQRMAKETTLKRRKDDCLIAEAREINPDITVKAFRDGVKKQNVQAFLEGRQWAVDVVDLFAMSDKLALNQAAHQMKIPVASCASLGLMGVMIVFDNQGGPSFQKLSGISDDLPYQENCQRFLRFAAPYVPGYMYGQLMKATDRSTHIPFLVPGVEIAAALAAAEITKHVLGIGERIVAPRGVYFDPFVMEAGAFTASYEARDLSDPRVAALPKTKKAA